jgi:hypothetical protein
MVFEIFESLFWVGPGFIPKSCPLEINFSNNRHEEKDVKETQNRSIKSDTILIVIRHLLGLKKQGEKIETCK